jgi:uncharacterized protein (TIGR03083 family)
VVDTSSLKDFDPFDLMDTESKRLVDFFASLDESGWAQDTRCEGWRRRELVSHLAAGESYNRACLDDKVQQLFEEYTKLGATDMNSFNDITVKERAERTADEVLLEWRGANDYTREQMRKRGRDGSIATSVGAYPVELQAFHLASEYATHADDMGAPVSEDEKLKRLAWRMAFSKVAVEEAGKPVQVAADADGNVHVKAADKEATLSEADFVEAVSGRLKTIDPELQDALRALA